MLGRPERNEAAPYYFNYIDRISSDDIVGVLAAQLDETPGFLAGISEKKSLHRYGPDKWSIRQVINHVSDTERVFLFRAFWFGRGFDTPLPSFDEKISAGAARADELPWVSHLEELRGVRLSTLAFFRNLPPRPGRAAGSPAGIPSWCGLWPTSRPAISPTTWRFSRSGICRLIGAFALHRASPSGTWKRVSAAPASHI